MIILLSDQNIIGIHLILYARERASVALIIFLDKIYLMFLKICAIMKL